MSGKRRKALITGISGQDGSYLAELLLAEGYEVHGTIRRASVGDYARKLFNIAHLREKLHLHTVTLDNHLSVYKVLREVTPDECYHLGASSFVSYSFDDEFSILSSNFNGTHYLLASIKEIVPQCRVYFAGSSEMFGRAEQSPQNESTPFHPRSIYGISKVAGYQLLRNYWDQYGLFACAGILYNHESPRRGFEFVTRRVTSSVAKIKLGLQKKITLGNLDARRDWGYAPEYVRAMWLMLQQEQPDDYVVATGETHTVREFVETAFRHAGLDYQEHVEFDQKLFRASETVPLSGDASKARKVLAWKPERPFAAIIAEMVDNDLALHSSKYLRVD